MMGVERCSSLVLRRARAVVRMAAGAVAAAAFASACASSGGAGAQGTASAVIGDSRGDGLEIGGLSPRVLDVGDCGLFLWSLSSQQLVFFSTTRQAEARMQLNEREVRLPRVATAGAPIIGGQMAQQRYRAPSVTATLVLRRGDEIDGGVRVAESTLRLVRDNGWSVVLPVAGLAYCRSSEDPVGGPNFNRPR